MKITCKSCQASFRIDARLVKPTGSNAKCYKCQQIFKILPPDVINRRKHTRTKTRNLISHITVDEDGKLVSQGLSKAIDISRGGILLETPHPIESGMISLMAIDLDNKLIEIKGELVYCRKTAAGIYHSGIKFVGSNEQVVKFVVRLIKEYNHRKNNFCGSLA
jgi:predicted Zn finger-like uncharacterized protein